MFYFLPYKPGASRPVASAPYKALKCFCLYPLAADKFNSSRAKHGVVVDFGLTAYAWYFKVDKNIFIPVLRLGLETISYFHKQDQWKKILQKIQEERTIIQKNER